MIPMTLRIVMVVVALAFTESGLIAGFLSLYSGRYLPRKHLPETSSNGEYSRGEKPGYRNACLRFDSAGCGASDGALAEGVHQKAAPVYGRVSRKSDVALRRRSGVDAWLADAAHRSIPRVRVPNCGEDVLDIHGSRTPSRTRKRWSKSARNR